MQEEVLLKCTIALVLSFALPLSAVQETNTPIPALTVNGATYSNATFGRVTPTTVSVFHSTGIATLQLNQLPLELQQKLGYDPNRAAEYEKTEHARLEQRRAAAAKADRAKTATHCHIQVVQVLSDGLLVMTKKAGYSWPNPATWEGPAFMINVPDFGNKTENAEFTSLCLNAGIYRYVDISGVARQVPKLEHLGSWTVKPEKRGPSSFGDYIPFEFVDQLLP